ncbi:type IV toxin-antitoxin system AbiEi family antitoxin domain-containing protein [Planctomicrobium sp. SH661]|uniref:type IV toxin-antitoxin system AbiEi family antitoxin domain-containing protein n=1 Tax=Planctomicrobium sp. SH661 TaxID=3448124 RepID=UPI003F5C8DD9
MFISPAKAISTFRQADQRIWNRNDLLRFVAIHLGSWVCPKSVKNAVRLQSQAPTAALDVLLEKIPLASISLAFPYRTVTRYVYGEASTQAIIQSVDSDGYFSHFSAMQFHNLTDQIPKSIYFNVEQPATGGGGALSQPALDRAFKGKCRVTSNVIEFRGHTIHKINGQNTGRLGVLQGTLDDGTTIQVTNLERTLIDIVVRPVYAGGIAQVADAYRNAADQISVQRLVSYLKLLNYTYPYHQAIGYYLMRAGCYSESQISELRKMPIDFDFYLTYQLRNPVLNEEWRLYVPKGF